MSLWYSVLSGKKCCCFTRQEGWRLEPEDLANPDSPLIFKGVVFNEMKGAMVRGAYLCSVSEWDVHVSSEWVRCTCVQWVSEMYMCPVSEWGVHVPSEWVRCTCVQWVSEMYMCPVSEWGVHVSSKWVREWFEKDG